MREPERERERERELYQHKINRISVKSFKPICDAIEWWVEVATHETLKAQSNKASVEDLSLVAQHFGTK